MRLIVLPHSLGGLKNWFTGELQSWQHARLIDFAGTHDPFPPTPADTLEHEHLLFVYIKDPVFAHTEGEILLALLLVIAQLGTGGHDLDHDFRYPGRPKILIVLGRRSLVDG